MTSKISQRFCAPDADITVSSSDGVLFKLHRKNLEVHSDVFADAENATRPAKDEVVQLSETSDVLDLLFQYMYRQPQPDLQKVEFGTFAGLAEAAEKYVVHSALAWCRMKMSESIPDHPLEVLEYAAKHQHEDLANEAARRSMGLGVERALTILSPNHFKAWIIFSENWNLAIKSLGLDIMKGKLVHDQLKFALQWFSDPNPYYNARLRQECEVYRKKSELIANMRFANMKS